MLLEPIPSELPHKAFDLAAFARAAVLRGITAAKDDPSEQKYRIMLARQCGFLCDEQTAAMIAQYGLMHA